ncbi:P-loop containing nucleoside triphosphate hydrolase [Phytophthora cactorum]|nr:P-loop containing nucleoside triphosphate hydrolase [Phytophthora cactorum]
MGTLSDNYRLSTALWMFVFDTVLYTVLGLYLEKVMPKEYGTTLKWYFPLGLNPSFEPVNADLREQEQRGESLTVKRLRKVFQVPGSDHLSTGHNGAGKTTLISMLTGMTAPSSGNATYPDGPGASQFFGQIKGYANEELQAVVEDRSKRNSRPNDLSGGMKPNPGMDPYSRRSTWEILLNNRNDRVMVLTTHFMDEADILVTDDAKCDDDAVTAFVSSFVRSATPEQCRKRDRVPTTSAELVKFATMFAEMDRQLQTLGLLSYGVSVTTLEEVFIKVAELGDENNQQRLETRCTDELRDHHDESIFQRHLRALLLKRFRYAKRDKKAIIYVAALPVLLIAVGLGISRQLWCSDVMASSYFSGANAQMLSIPEPAFDSNSPTVFDRQPPATASHWVNNLRAWIGKGADLVEGQYGGICCTVTATRIVWLQHLHNTTASHSSVVFKALMDQAVLSLLRSEQLYGEQSPVAVHGWAKAVLTPTVVHRSLICIAFTFLPASIVVFLVKEKQAEHNSKHQQLVSGVSLPAFWLSNYIWDFLLVATFPAVILLFILFGLATYTIVLNFMIGVVLMLTSFILDMFGSTSDVNSVLKFLWRFLAVHLGSALLNMVTADVTASSIAKMAKRIRSAGTSWAGNCCILSTAAGYMIFVTLYLDYAKTFAKTKDDLARGHADEDAVKLVGLRKVYPGGKVAVRNLSFAVHGTATLGGFDILSQQIEVRRQIGYCPQFDALFDLLSVREHLELFGAIKGIPQASLDRVVMEKIQQLNLGDFEHKLAGSLSGGNKLSRRFMWDVIADISTRGKESTIVLTTHSMEECEALCSRVGIMVGVCSTSSLVFGDGLVFDVKLDMPSADELEYLVQHIFGSGSEFVTPVELEDKCHAFGNADLAERVTASHPTGYSLAAAMERDGFIRAEAFYAFDELSDYLVRAFGAGQVVVMERQTNDFARFKVRSSNNEVKLSKMFALVEDVKAKMHIREYSVSQTTLEQIFNSFASQQEEEQGVVRGVFQQV